MNELKIFIGYDSREDDAYQVAKFSLLRHTNLPLVIRPLKLDDLRQAGLYYRPQDPLASTQFTYSRFLVPVLCNFKGSAIFFDCDFLWLDDVKKLIEVIDPAKAVSCVQHDYRPRESIKMDGMKQTIYPRKNWSSLMFFDCSHPDCQNLTVTKVNTETPKYLHRFEWTKDSNIGKIPLQWNWLEGWNSCEAGDPVPSAIHFTRGGPWFKNYEDVEYADVWRSEFDLYNKSLEP